MLCVLFLLLSCNSRKSTYDIDSLIEGYAFEEGTEYIDVSEEDSIMEVLSTEEDTDEPAGSESDTTQSESESLIIEGEPTPTERIKVKNLGRLAEVFNDSNYRQYEYAEKLGIAPIRSISDAFHTRRPIVKVTSNSAYTVDELTHSLPYLVPEAERLLRDIGRNFQDTLKNRGKARYRIRATSLLRTPATVKKLRRVNINATDSSTHQFGTTFDLSYHRFHCLDTRYEVSAGDLKNVLAEVLYDLRAQGRCLVKFERKTGCFHVTVTK